MPLCTPLYLCACWYKQYVHVFVLACRHISVSLCLYRYIYVLALCNAVSICFCIYPRCVPVYIMLYFGISASHEQEHSMKALFRDFNGNI